MCFTAPLPPFAAFRNKKFSSLLFLKPYHFNRFLATVFVVHPFFSEFCQIQDRFFVTCDKDASSSKSFIDFFFLRR